MTNNEVKAIIRDMKKNKLYKRVISEIVSDSNNYSGDNMQERIKARLNDISYGLSTGIVGSMVYYNDTVKFFNLYRKEIEELVTNNLIMAGSSINDLNGFDIEDPFIRETNNKNILAWFAYETIAYELNDMLSE